MSKKFLIGGTIVADDSQKWAYEDVTPSQVRAILSKLENGEDVTFEITSPGGDVASGIAIANLIREASKRGNPCKAHVIGIAASMASVIACACDEVDIDESAFMMIHNPWTVTQGDADDLRKSAAVLDKMRDAIITFYRSKFDKSDDELKAMMDFETWFTGAECATFGFRANVIKGDDLRAAACARNLPAFGKMPELASKLFVLGTELKAEVAEVTASDGSEPADEKPAAVETETAAGEGETAAVEGETAAVEGETAAVETETAAGEGETAAGEGETAAVETVTRDECERRVSGMQQSMQRQINELRAQYDEAQRRSVALLAETEKEFNAKLVVKDQELTAARAEVTRLTNDLAKVTGELSDRTSALVATKSALDQLNASVLTPRAVKVERTYDEVVNDPKAKPAEKLAAAKKEVARRAAKN